MPPVADIPDLPDINFWLAVVDENHVHHQAAKRYWREAASTQLFFCRVSMLGFLRLSTQPRVLSRPLATREAWQTYRRFLALPEIQFRREPENLETIFALISQRSDLPHSLWTDAYLAAFAIADGCRLVSFDADFHRFPDLSFLHLVG